MEKKLLLLSILRAHEAHGYQLNEMLAQSVGIPLTLTRPNAYKLLNKMEQDGWVSYREEQQGNRPPRRVYAITDDGEAAFQQMLRDSLVAYSTPEIPGALVFNYLDLLPADEAAALLGQRREKIGRLFDELNEMPADIREAHPGVEYLLRFYESEIAWVEAMIAQLNGM